MKKLVSVLLSVLMFASVFAGINIPVSAIGQYGVDINSGSYVSNDNPFTRKGYWGECTWYCWGRANENGTSLWWGSDTYGNAMSWYDNASGYYQCDQNPSANSIMVSPDGWTKDGKQVGHVMYVEKVLDGYAYISEANYKGNGATSINWNGRYSYYHEDVINLSNNRRNWGSGSYVNITGYIHIRCTTHTWDGGKITTKPTCKKNGVKTYTCTVCGETKAEKIAKGEKYHQYEVKATVKATTITNGELGKQCKLCGKKAKSIIYHPKTYTLAKSSLTYNGKWQKPAVTVKDTKGKVIDSKYYSLSYKNNKTVGKATVSVKFKGRYSGTKTLNFKIVPKGTKINELTANSSSLTARWDKQPVQTTGYQIQYATNMLLKNSKTITISKTSTIGRKITGLSSGKIYYVRIRTYKKIGKSKYCSAWSSRKTGIISGIFISSPCVRQSKEVSYGEFIDCGIVGEKIYGYYYYLAGNNIYLHNKGYETSIYRTTSIKGKRTKIVTVKSKNSVIKNFITDGNSIYYLVSSPSESAIYKIGTNGKNNKLILKEKSTKTNGKTINYNIIYSVVGCYDNCVYYKTVGSTAGLYKYNLKTKKKTVLYKNASDFATFLSSNGRYMLFASSVIKNNANALILFDAQTGKKKKVAEGIAGGLTGNKIYYATYEPNNGLGCVRIYCCNLNGKNKTFVCKNVPFSLTLLFGEKNFYFYSYDATNKIGNYYSLNYKSKKLKKVLSVELF